MTIDTKNRWHKIIRRFKNYAVLILAALMFSTLANFNVYEFKDPAKAREFKALIAELRCPTCQNNNLADSNAPLAADIKNYIYQSIKAGKSREEITEFLISRYGEFITYRPRNRWLWILPPLVGGVALLIAVVNIGKKRRVQAEAQGGSQSPAADMQSIIRQYQEEKGE